VWSKLFKLTRTLFSPLGLGHFLAPLHPRTTSPFPLSPFLTRGLCPFLSSSLSLLTSLATSLSFSSRVFVALSSHCPVAEFKIAPDDLVAFVYQYRERMIRGLRASLLITGDEIGTRQRDRGVRRITRYAGTIHMWMQVRSMFKRSRVNHSACSATSRPTFGSMYPGHSSVEKRQNRQREDKRRRVIEILRK